MRTPKVTLPEEDPATKAAREREQARAESARTEETQALLLGDTVRRLRRFGRVGGSGGSVPIYNPTTRGATTAINPRASATGGTAGLGGFTAGNTPGRTLPNVQLY